MACAGFCCGENNLFPTNLVEFYIFFTFNTYVCYPVRYFLAPPRKDSIFV